MIFQKIRSEIVLKIPPNAVHVVRSILSVVVLQNERARLNAIIVRFTGFETARPPEMKFLDAASLDFCNLFSCDVVPAAKQVFL